MPRKRNQIQEYIRTLFVENETAEHPLTDAQIGQRIRERFPANPKAATPDRIRLYRVSANGGYGCYEGLPALDPPSREYDSNGDIIIRKRGRKPGTQPRSAKPKPESKPQPKPKPQPKSKRRKGEHPLLEEALLRMDAGIDVLLVGPTGSGKTTLAAQIAQRLKLDFTFNSFSEGVSESALLGRMLPSESGKWIYRKSPFVHTYKNGGLHLLDEMDGADPNLLVTVNAALANGFLSVPFAQTKPVPRHPECKLIAAANTYGKGADRQYVGRNQLDEATIDRWRMGILYVDYDRDLERDIVESMNLNGSASALLDWAWTTRETIAKLGFRRNLSTRLIVKGAKLLNAGMDMAKVKEAYYADWSEDERSKVENS